MKEWLRLLGLGRALYYAYHLPRSLVERRCNRKPHTATATSKITPIRTIKEIVLIVKILPPS